MAFSIKKINFPRGILASNQCVSDRDEENTFIFKKLCWFHTFVYLPLDWCTYKSRGKQTMFRRSVLNASSKLKNFFVPCSKEKPSSIWGVATLMIKLSFEFPQRKEYCACRMMIGRYSVLLMINKLLILYANTDDERCIWGNNILQWK